MNKLKMLLVSNLDKVYHFICGFLICLAGSLCDIRVGLPLGIIAGIVKEGYDYLHPQNHSVEMNDIFATWLGAFVGFALFYLLFMV